MQCEEEKEYNLAHEQMGNGAEPFPLVWSYLWSCGDKANLRGSTAWDLQARPDITLELLTVH